MNTFGKNFRISIFGESHGTLIGVVLDGVTPNIALSEQDFELDLKRRKSGAVGTTPRLEGDVPEIVSGVVDGKTTGAPLAIIFRNENTKSKDYSHLRDTPRPGHSDFTANAKYLSANDLRGGGHFSGRLTLTLVAAGVVAKKMIEGIKISANVIEVGGKSTVHTRDMIAQIMEEEDSVGGIVECRAVNVPIGLGDPFFDSLESQIAHIVFSIPAVRGIEFGDGFEAARMKGSQHNDLIIDEKGTTATNGAGGVNGGISNGNPIVFRLAIKPTSSINKSQMTYNFATNEIEELKIGGRHDACIALRCPVIVESVLAIVLADNLVVTRK